MNRNVVVVAAIGALAYLCFASALTAGPATSTKSFRMDTASRGTNHFTGKFILQLGTAGDLGRMEGQTSDEKYAKTPDGLEFLSYNERDTFTGKAGAFVLRIVGRGYNVGGGTNVNTSGTWSVARGTGMYAGMHGRGRWAGVHSQAKLSEQRRYAGTVALSS